MASLTSSANAAPASTAENATAKPVDRIVTPLEELVPRGMLLRPPLQRECDRAPERRGAPSPGHARLGQDGAAGERVGVVGAKLERARHRIFEIVRIEHILHRERPEEPLIFAA